MMGVRRSAIGFERGEIGVSGSEMMGVRNGWCVRHSACAAWQGDGAGGEVNWGTL